MANEATAPGPAPTAVVYWDCTVCGWATVTNPDDRAQLVRDAVQHVMTHVTGEIDYGLACAGCETVYHSLDAEAAARCCNPAAVIEAVSAAEGRLRQALGDPAVAQALDRRQPAQLLEATRAAAETGEMSGESFAKVVADIEIVANQGDPRAIRRLG